MVTGRDPTVPLQNRETYPDPAQTKGTYNFTKNGSHLIKENNINFLSIQHSNTLQFI